MQSIFLFPIALGGLALLGLPVIVHLLNRRKADPLYFPSLRFITASRTTMLRLHKVNNVPLLLLRLLIFALIVFAAARPFRLPFVSASANPQAIILVDASASMNAKGRWSEAIKQARSVIERQPENSRIALLSFADDGKIISDPKPKSEIIATLNAFAGKDWQPSGASMKWDKCAQFLKDFLATNSIGEGRVFVISDFQASNFTLDQSTSGWPANVEMIDVHGFDNNRSVQLPTLENLAGKLKLRTIITSETKTENGIDSKFSDAEFSVPADNKASESLDAKSGVVLKLVPSIPGYLTGTLSGGWSDDLDSDNTVYFSLKAPSQFNVIVLRGPNSSEQLIESERYLNAALSSLSAGIPEKPGNNNLPIASGQTDRIIVVADFREIIDPEWQSRLSEYVNRGGHLWLIAPDASDAEFINSKLSSVSELSPITAVQREDAHNISLSDVFDATLGQAISESTRRQLASIGLSRDIKIVASPQSNVLLKYTDGAPALVSRKVGQGDVLVWGLPLGRKASSLATGGAFPLLCQALINRTSDQSNSFAIDTQNDNLRFTALLRSVGNVKGIDIVSGNGGLPQNPARLSEWQPGLYKLRGESAEAVISINQSEVESHPGAVSEAQRKQLFKTDSVKSGPASVIKGKEESEKSFWRYLLIGAVILLGAELAFSFYAVNRLSGEVLS